MQVPQATEMLQYLGAQVGELLADRAAGLPISVDRADELRTRLTAARGALSADDALDAAQVDRHANAYQALIGVIDAIQHGDKKTFDVALQLLREAFGAMKFTNLRAEFGRRRRSESPE